MVLLSHRMGDSFKLGIGGGVPKKGRVCGTTSVRRTGQKCLVGSPTGGRRNARGLPPNWDALIGGYGLQSPPLLDRNADG